LGVEVNDSMVSQNLLRSLPMIFDPKISSLKERENLGTLSMDELHGIFIAYEMRIEQENSVMKETTFKASKKTKNKNKKNSKPICSCSDDLDEDEKMANFTRKLKKRIDKYKGMLPLKCFNCGGIGHLASNFYHKNKGSDGEEASKRENTYQKGKKRINKTKFFKKSFYLTKDSSSLDEEDNYCDSDSKRVIFMEVEYDDECSKEEVELDLREELFNSL
jgi:hypothetical protein